MSEIQLIVETDRFKRTASKQISGPIYFCFPDGKCFPEKGWVDFPLIVLSWWTGDLSGESEFELLFMEGSDQLKFTKNGSTGFLTTFPSSSVAEGSTHSLSVRSLNLLITQAWQEVLRSEILNEQDLQLAKTCIELLDSNSEDR